MRRYPVLLVFALALALLAPGRAFAYFSYPAPSISLPGSVTLASGETASVTCAVSPMSEQQLPGCGMAECPQACDGLETPDGVVGGCMSADGWCTCAGTGYYTATTNVSVSSSDPSIVRASWAGGVLQVSGYKPGTATLSVYATLSKHDSSEAYVTVTVVESSGGGGAAAGGGAADAGDGSVVVTPGNGGGAAAVVNHGGSGSGNGAAQVVERQSSDGSRVVLVEATTADAAVEQLEQAVEKGGEVTLWNGGAVDSPDISLTLDASKIDASALKDFDPTARVSKKGEGALARLLGTAGARTIVVTFAQEGRFPAEADAYVRASLVFDDGDVVGLYRYDAQAGSFDLVKGDVEVSDGYARFALDEGATYVLADVDLTQLNPGGVDESGVDASKVNTQADSGVPYLAVAGIAVVVAVAAGCASYFARKRRDDAVDE